jgi:hypothetical protein
MIVVALGLALVHPFARGGWGVHWEFVVLIWLAMASCLAHAKFDFPFQIYSILLLFVLLAAILCSVRLRRNG